MKLSRRGALTFVMTTDEAATGTVTGTVRVSKPSRAVRFKAAAVSLAVGKLTTLTTRLSKHHLRTVRKALRRHKLKGRVTVTVHDAGGNQAV